jgi:peptidoglycan hydrolase-like protein with peptidoglycan-binding domain
MIVSSPQDVQNALNKLGYGPLAVDSILGPITQAAVKRFQTDHALVVDGKAGPQTKAALTAALANQGNLAAQAAIVADNSAPPTNVTAAHLPATSGAPAMTVHTTAAPSGSTSTSVKAFGTPTSTSSLLAVGTGATPTGPNAKAPLKTKIAGMTNTQKVLLGLGAAALAAGAYFGGKK